MGKRRMPRVYLIRHGETEWSLNGRHTGVSDIPLTANGERIIREMGPKVIGESNLINPDHLRHIIVSPRARAQKTAQLLFGDHPPKKCYWHTDPEVAEWDYGAYEGKLSKDIRAERPDWDIWTMGCPPGETPGETPEQMSDRVDRAERTAASPEEIDHADVLIITHGHFTRCFIPRWCNLPLQAGYNFAADPGGVAVLGYQHMSLKEPCLNWYTEESLNSK